MSVLSSWMVLAVYIPINSVLFSYISSIVFVILRFWMTDIFNWGEMMPHCAFYLHSHNVVDPDFMCWCHICSLARFITVSEWYLWVPLYKGSYHFLLSYLCPFDFFVLSNDSGQHFHAILNQNNESGHACLSRSTSSFPPFSMLLSVVCHVLPWLCWCFFVLCMTGCCILPNAFSASFEVIVWLLSFFLLMWYHMLIDLHLLKPSLYSWFVS